MKTFDKRGLPTRTLMAQALVLLLALPPYSFPQQPPTTPTPPPQAQIRPMGQLPIVKNLKVSALVGADGMNDLERHVMSPLVVQVLDQDDRPVEAAEVVFRFPLEGPGASFADGKTSRTVRTNGQGQAAALGWMANDQVGAFEVKVTATYASQMGDATIPMLNVTRIVEEPKKASKNGGWWTPTKVKLIIAAGAVAAVAAIVIVKTTGGSGTPTVTISPGAPTVGGPR